MRDLLVFALVFGSLPFVVKRPWFGILVWFWLSFMNPHRLTWGMAYDFPFSQLVALCLFLGVLLSDEPKRIPVTNITIVWLLFFLWTALTYNNALIWWTAEIEWSRWWKINLTSVLTLMLITNRERIHALIWVIGVSLGFYGIKGGIFAVLTRGEGMVFGPPGSFIGDNTSLGLALIVALPLLRYMQLEAKSKFVYFSLAGAMGLTALAILATQSRGALLGIAGMGVFLAIKSKNWLRMGIVVSVMLALLVAFMPSKWMDKMNTIQTYEEDTSAMGRINAWWFAYYLAKDRPLLGGGFGTFNPRIFPKYAPDPEDFHDAHSIYFEVLGEQGFVGFGLFVLLGILAYRAASWIIRNSRRRDDLDWARNLAGMIQASFVGYGCAGAFLGLAYFDLYYTLIAIIVLTKVEVQKRLAETGEPAYVAPFAERRVQTDVGGSGAS